MPSRCSDRPSTRFSSMTGVVPPSSRPRPLTSSIGSSSTPWPRRTRLLCGRRATASRTARSTVMQTASPPDWPRAGLGEGALVGILAEQPADAIVAMLAALKAGAAYVPLDARLPDTRLLRMVTALHAIVATPSLVSRVADTIHTLALDDAADFSGLVSTARRAPGSVMRGLRRLHLGLHRSAEGRGGGAGPARGVQRGTRH